MRGGDRRARSPAASGSPRARSCSPPAPWSAALAAAAGLPLPLEPRKGQLVRLAAPAPGLIRHKVVDGSYLRSVASADAGLEVSTVVETTWEGDVLVGSSRERRGFDTRVDPAVSDAMVARAARLFPRLPRLRRRRRVGRAAPVAARPPAGDRPVAARARACGSPRATRARASRSAPSRAG